MRATVIRLSILSVLLTCTASCGTGEDFREPYVRDARACAKTNVSLEEAVKHFGIFVPSTAAKVQYYADLHPLRGTYSLRLYFQVDGNEVRNFLTRGGFGRASRDSDVTSFPKLTSKCSPPASSFRLVEYADGSTGNFVKSALIYRTATSLSHVTVSAEDEDL